MVPFFQYVENLDAEKPDNIDILKKKGKVRLEVERERDLNEVELELYQKL